MVTAVFLKTPKDPEAVEVDAAGIIRKDNPPTGSMSKDDSAPLKSESPIEQVDDNRDDNNDSLNEIESEDDIEIEKRDADIDNVEAVENNNEKAAESSDQTGGETQNDQAKEETFGGFILPNVKTDADNFTKWAAEVKEGIDAAATVMISVGSKYKDLLSSDENIERKTNSDAADAETAGSLFKEFSVAAGSLFKEFSVAETADTPALIPEETFFVEVQEDVDVIETTIEEKKTNQDGTQIKTKRKVKRANAVDNHGCFHKMKLFNKKQKIPKKRGEKSLRSMRDDEKSLRSMRGDESYVVKIDEKELVKKGWKEQQKMKQKSKDGIPSSEDAGVVASRVPNTSTNDIKASKKTEEKKDDCAIVASPTCETSNTADLLKPKTRKEKKIATENDSMAEQEHEVSSKDETIVVKKTKTGRAIISSYLMKSKKSKRHLKDEDNTVSSDVSSRKSPGRSILPSPTSDTTDPLQLSEVGNLPSPDSDSVNGDEVTPWCGTLCHFSEPPEADDEDDIVDDNDGDVDASSNKRRFMSHFMKKTSSFEKINDVEDEEDEEENDDDGEDEEESDEDDQSESDLSQLYLVMMRLEAEKEKVEAAQYALEAAEKEQKAAELEKKDEADRLENEMKELQLEEEHLNDHFSKILEEEERMLKEKQELLELEKQKAEEKQKKVAEILLESKRVEKQKAEEKEKKVAEILLESKRVDREEKNFDELVTECNNLKVSVQKGLKKKKKKEKRGKAKN